MEEQTINNNPTAGTWDNLSTEETERKPKVEFELNKPVTVQFMDDNPKEMPSKSTPGEVYYIIDVLQNNEDKVIMTSAWSLLRGLKMLAPLANRKVSITKVMENGKQHFNVSAVI